MLLCYDRCSMHLHLISVSNLFTRCTVTCMANPRMLRISFKFSVGSSCSTTAVVFRTCIKPSTSISGFTPVLSSARHSDGDLRLRQMLPKICFQVFLSILEASTRRRNSSWLFHQILRNVRLLSRGSVAVIMRCPARGVIPFIVAEFRQ